MVLVFDALDMAALTIAGRGRARDEAEVVAEGRKKNGLNEAAVGEVECDLTCVTSW